MVTVVTRNAALFADMLCTPDVEGGIGPVMFGVPLVEDGSNPRYACIHPFAEIDRAWIEAYCSGETPTVEIMETLPPDWKYPRVI